MFGTNFTYDLLVTRQAQTIQEIGVQKVYDGIEQGLEIHNRLTAEVFSLFGETKNETVPGQFRYETYGANGIIRMRKVDQIGLVDAQKVTAGYTVGFPMERVQAAVQWTRDFIENATAEELVKDFNAAKEGDLIGMQNDLLASIFTPFNRTVTERFHNGVDVQVKALINGDGSQIPEGPNGETFDGGTHNHYLASATVTQPVVKAAIDTVKEHYRSGVLRLFINKQQEAAVRGFADFVPYVQAGIVPGGNVQTADGVETAIPLDDREIGLLFGCVVTVKPWMPINYWMVLITGAAIQKVVRFRQRKNGLYVAAQMASYPLQADVLEHDYGVGVLERTAASILYTGGAAYVPLVFA